MNATEKLRRMDDLRALQSAYRDGYEAGLKVAQGLMQPPAPILLCAECPRKAAVLSACHSEESGLK